VSTKIDREFVMNAMQRARAAAAEVSRHPHSKKLSTAAKAEMEQYRLSHHVRKLERV
jgi:hypothetical protein